jgi:adenosyl cobinamide kinase/adenosyl cobinamide phosphate guanylyltransferase
MKSEILFITGGSWSGKTNRALALASAFERVAWLGTAVANLPGISSRVETIKSSFRPGWCGIDAPLELSRIYNQVAAKDSSTLIVIDSISQWISNEIARLASKHDEQQIAAAIMRDAEDLCLNIRERQQLTIVVSSDFGQSVPPQDAGARLLRMCTGKTNQLLSAIAHRTEIMMAGVVFSSLGQIPKGENL